ncbi:hypothetical protein [Ammonifex thiophilus]|uniref:Uncharacterized protein n=1 Tax=Ammonifex thiophilus TaxID=444093 RepID=A0A3D8P0Y0_9THEO|nr:hypothetical protein [Ammonifex thiophilus]RDV80892.1 hypothetical protein DXX99_10285 [Ammonifex thiophilus]
MEQKKCPEALHGLACGVYYGVVVLSRILQVRLPDDHWIWGEPDRSAVVRQALDFYRKVGDRLDLILRRLEEMEERLACGDVTARPGEVEEKPVPKIDPRLIKGVSKFLDL